MRIGVFLVVGTTFNVIGPWHPPRGLGGVFWLKERHRLAADWHAFADTYAQAHGQPLTRGERRMLMPNVAVADSRAEAMTAVRAGHDEFRRCLASRADAPLRPRRHPAAARRIRIRSRRPTGRGPAGGAVGRRYAGLRAPQIAEIARFDPRPIR